MPKNVFVLFVLSTLLLSCKLNVETPKETDPLSLWNTSEVKTEMINFVSAVTKENSPDYVPVKKRIAVFDNDGTLWNEKPFYIPVEFEISQIKKKYPSKPGWKENKLYKGLAEGNLAVMKEFNTLELINELFASHDGEMEEEYKKTSYEFLSNNHHAKYNRPFKELTYSPMVELVDYLQDNNFQVYIVTGGEITFLRTVSEEIYNIPVENVVGSSVLLKYVSDEKGDYLIRTGKVNSANDKHIKPTNIELHIGQKPIFAAGNSDGDYEMMEYTLAGDGPSMAILVHHDDEEREYSYMHGTEKAVEDAKEQGWYVISMKNDFKEIFAE